MTAGDGIALGAQVFGEVFFHFDRCFEGHGVEVLVEFGHEAEAVCADSPGGFVAVLMVFEAMLHGQAGHADVDARLFRVATGIGAKDRRVLRDLRIEQDHIDAVVEVGGHRCVWAK